MVVNCATCCVCVCISVQGKDAMERCGWVSGVVRVWLSRSSLHRYMAINYCTLKCDPVA